MEDTRLDVTPIVQQASPVTESYFFGSGGILAWKKFPQFRAVRWFAAAALAVGLSAIVTVVSLELLRNKGYLSANQPAPVSSKVASPTQTVSTAAEPKAAAPSPLVPTSFGIFAISGKLRELDVMPARAPDASIAISSLITTPSRATLPDGHASFIVYRRNSATNAADRAEVRLIARVEKEANFDNDGEQATTGINDNWVIRNISMPYRTAPKKDNPEMYEVRSEKSGRSIAAGPLRVSA